MTKLKKIMPFRHKRASELERFAQLLEKVDLGSMSQIYQVISNLKNEGKKYDYRGTIDNDYWGYRIDGLTFIVQDFPKRHVKPNVDRLQLSIDIDFLSSFDNWEKLKDPLLKLNFKVQISGVHSNEKYSFGFHVDRHEDGSSEEIHPIYHLHYSPAVGDNENIGKVLSLDAPRIMHAPIDLILGIDFVLSNFSPSTWHKLRKEPEYISLCKQYQNSFWKPYVHAWASSWKYEATEICWNSPKSICPHLIQ